MTDQTISTEESNKESGTTSNRLTRKQYNLLEELLIENRHIITGNTFPDALPIINKLTKDKYNFNVTRSNVSTILNDIHNDESNNLTVDNFNFRPVGSIDINNEIEQLKNTISLLENRIINLETPTKSNPFVR